MRERGEPSKQLLNSAVRDGLRVVHAKPEKPFRQRTFDMGLPLVDLTKANALAAELEDQELISKLRAGR